MKDVLSAITFVVGALCFVMFLNAWKPGSLSAVPSQVRHVLNGETTMRTFIFAVAAIVAASWATDQAMATDRVPAFDIVRNCSAEVAAAGIEKVADCTKDETDAKNELDNRWPEFGASNKQACVGESSVGAGQSYVELLTCLEMSSREFLAGRH